MHTFIAKVLLSENQSRLGLTYLGVALAIVFYLLIHLPSTLNIIHKHQKEN